MRNENLYKSGDVIANLKKGLGDVAAYPYAFGYAWALLTEKQRKELIKIAEEKAKEAN
jgi:hypothetical protein